MAEKNLPLSSFSIGGYRSFGEKIQRFGKLSRINLFIGQNNCGKSNVLRFLHEIYPTLTRSNKGINLSPLDRHLPVDANFILGVAISLCKNDLGDYSAFNNAISSKISKDSYQQRDLSLILEVFQKKAELDGTGENVWFDFDTNKALINENGNW